jgi:hypothetical protein
MTDLQITTLSAQTSDNERMLLARILKATAGRIPTRSTLLVSATRTANTATATLDLSSYSAVVCYLNISSSSGTGGLRLIPEYLDPVSGLWRAPIQTGAANTTLVGLVPYMFGPGLGTLMTATANVGVVAAIPLVSAMRFSVIPTDASSYTYSLGYEAL